MSSTREWLLRRARAVCRAIAPGVTFIPPGLEGAAARPCETDLGGRVFELYLPPELAGDELQLPYVCVVEDPESELPPEYLDGTLVRGTLSLHIVAYGPVARVGDGSLQATARPDLNDLRADLVSALHAIPFWVPPTAEAPEDLVDATARAGASRFDLTRDPGVAVYDAATSGAVEIRGSVPYFYETFAP